MFVKLINVYTSKLDFLHAPINFGVQTVADPGFPVGASSCRGVPTSNAGTFWQKCMHKQKNCIQLGAVHRQCPPPPPDPPMKDSQG